MITGTILGSPNHSEVNVHFTSCERKLHEQVENFWKVGGFGAKPLCKPIIEEPVPRRQNHYLSREDIRAVDILEKTTRLTDGHYETGLLWRKDDVELPNNRKEAEKR